MATVSNGCTASTTFGWRKVKIQAPPRPQGTARAKRARLAAEPTTQKTRSTDARKAHYVEIRYRGGAEAFWELSYAGRTKRVPGWWQIHDVMREVLQMPDL